MIHFRRCERFKINKLVSNATRLKHAIFDDIIFVMGQVTHVDKSGTGSPWLVFSFFLSKMKNFITN